jgi:hypothetical protein
LQFKLKTLFEISLFLTMEEDTPMEDVDAGNVVESMETDNAPEDAADGLVTDKQWHAMRDVLEAVLNYRDEK